MVNWETLSQYIKLFKAVYLHCSRSDICTVLLNKFHPVLFLTSKYMSKVTNRSTGLMCMYLHCSRSDICTVTIDTFHSSLFLTSKYMFKVTNRSTGLMCWMFLWMCLKVPIRTPAQQTCTYSKATIETKEKSEICSKLTIKSPEQRQQRRCSVFIVSFSHISLFVTVLLLLWKG